MDGRRQAHLRIFVAAAIVALAPAMTTAQDAFTELHAFAGTEGSTNIKQARSLIQASDGYLYGTNNSGGTSGYGTVFKMTPVGTVTVLHAFAGGLDGAYPAAALIQATDGSFYGTTGGGGTSGNGTVFKMTPSGTVTVLHAFAGGLTDGAHPEAPLIQATDGNFYGTTSAGGTSGRGTIFQMTPSSPWTVTVLHAFAGGTDGASPSGALIQAADGNFYGTTAFGGGFRTCPIGPDVVTDCGTVFQMTPAGTVTVLHAFTHGTDEGHPVGIIQATDGTFYGTTGGGGTSHDGTVFTLTPNGTGFAVLHTFAGGPDDGLVPESSLIQANNGNFYGTTAEGGASNLGTVFKMTPSGTVTILHAFAGGLTDGARPYSALIQGTDGAFYGTNDFVGGVPGYSVVFKLTLAGAPAITTEPLSQTIASGQFAYLSVVASGSGLSYQWYVGTTAVTTKPIAGATASSYMTPALTSTTSYWVRVSNSVATADSTTATVIVTGAPGDFDGDGKADLTVFRPSNGTWYELLSGTNYTTATGMQWGNSLDTPVPGDYDGDGKTDVAVFRPSNGTWYIVNSSTGSGVGYQWGNGSDVPVPGDYDGDGKTDIAVFRPSNGTWYIVYSSTGGGVGYQWGNGLDVPVPGDYDGDGKTDIAVFRPSNGTWYIVYSSTGGGVGYQWGNGNDEPVPGDYDGDGKTDIAVFRPSNSTWYIVYSSTGGAAGFQWGNGNDVPVPGDYDGDRKTDLAVFRPSNGTWYLWYSSTGTTAGYQWGNGNDIPILKRP